MTELAFQDTDTVKRIEFPRPERPDLGARCKKLFAGLGVALATAAVGYWLLADNDHVATDNAYVGAETAQVTPLVSGPVDSVAVVNTQAVKRGDILGAEPRTYTITPLSNCKCNRPLSSRYPPAAISASCHRSSPRIK